MPAVARFWLSSPAKAFQQGADQLVPPIEVTSCWPLVGSVKTNNAPSSSSAEEATSGTSRMEPLGTLLPVW